MTTNDEIIKNGYGDSDSLSYSDLDVMLNEARADTQSKTIQAVREKLRNICDGYIRVINRRWSKKDIKSKELVFYAELAVNDIRKDTLAALDKMMK